MIQMIKHLAADVKSRTWRGFAVAVLVVIAICTAEIPLEPLGPLGSFLEPLWLQQTAYGIVLSISFVLILSIIVSDSARGLHFSKTAAYSTIVFVTLWIVSFVAYLSSPDMPLVQQEITRDASGAIVSGSLTVAPVIMMTFFSLLMIISGVIAYAIGRYRKDIKGIKKETLFK